MCPSLYWYQHRAIAASLADTDTGHKDLLPDEFQDDCVTQDYSGLTPRYIGTR